jgi:hypothetical protein
MEAYFLPSGVRIDFERIVDAALEEEEYPQTYLDTVTGILIEVASREMFDRWHAEIGNTDRYVLIERYPDEERDKEAQGFIQLILKEMAGEYALQAETSFEQGGWRALEHYLEHHTDGWLDGWDHFVEDAAGEYVHEWLTSTSDLPITVEFEGCGDCAMFRLMASDEDSDPEALKEMVEAMETENVMHRVQIQMELYAKRKDTKQVQGRQSDTADESTTGAD